MRALPLLAVLLVAAGCSSGSTERPTLGDLGRGMADAATRARLPPPPDWPIVCREIRPAATAAFAQAVPWRTEQRRGDYLYLRKGLRFLDADGVEISRQTGSVAVRYVSPTDRRYARTEWVCPDFRD